MRRPFSGRLPDQGAVPFHAAKTSRQGWGGAFDGPGLNQGSVPLQSPNAGQHQGILPDEPGCNLPGGRLTTLQSGEALAEFPDFPGQS